MTTYEGWRGEDGLVVGKRESRSGRLVPLRPRRDLSNHSPDGFEWGYEGSGPAQLALAILADALGDDDKAVRCHQQFKRAVICVLPRERWSLTGDAVIAAIAGIEAGDAA
jgi:hypothetical protein